MHKNCFGTTKTEQKNGTYEHSLIITVNKVLYSMDAFCTDRQENACNTPCESFIT